ERGVGGVWGEVGRGKGAPGRAVDPGGVLNDDRLGGAGLRLDLRLSPWITVARRIVEDIDDVSGHHPQHHEDDDRYPEQGQDHQREAPREISTQESVLSYGVRRSLHPRPAKRGEGIGVCGCRCSAQRSSQTSSKRQPLYELFVMMVTPFTCGAQQLARRECKMIGRATSSCSFLSISQTSRLRFSRSVSADC